MSDFEDKLNKLLNDPDEMERFAGFAKSLMSGSAAEQPEPAPDIDPSMLKKISGMLSGKGGAGRDAKLLEIGEGTNEVLRMVIGGTVLASN